MNNPGLLIRDEPTKGLDPVNRRLLMYIIEEHKRSGASVITVTHQMEEVERLCDRVILLKDRVSRVYGTVEEVQEELGGTVYRVHCPHRRCSRRTAASPAPSRGASSALPSLSETTPSPGSIGRFGAAPCWSASRFWKK
jgi:ABC-type multidrug transport system ATPase subunit